MPLFLSHDLAVLCLEDWVCTQNSGLRTKLKNGVLLSETQLPNTSDGNEMFTYITEWLLQISARAGRERTPVFAAELSWG